jgi:hypothetical protein
VLGRRAGGTPWGSMPLAVSAKCGRSLADKIAKSRRVSRPDDHDGSREDRAARPRRSWSACAKSPEGLESSSLERKQVQGATIGT